MHPIESARPRSFALILLIVASTSSACTRSVIVAAEDVPTLVAMRSNAGGEDIRVPTLDGDFDEVPRDFETLRVVPHEGRVFMSPPGQPDLAVPVAREYRSDRRQDGWRLAPSSFSVPLRAEVEGDRLYVAGRHGSRGRDARRSTERPLAYRTEEVQGVAVEVPDTLGTTGVVIGVTTGVAAVAAAVAVTVVLSSFDGMNMSGWGRPE